MNNILHSLREHGIINSLDVHLAHFISHISSKDEPEILLATALVSNATHDKHVCLDLEEFAGKKLLEQTDRQKEITCPPVKKWRRTLLNCAAVGTPGDDCPLILDKKNRLYFHRYWLYETSLSAGIKKRIAIPPPFVDVLQLIDSLKRVFPDGEDSYFDQQQIVSITACFRRFCVITGGPGTGKTTTVAKIIAILLEQPDGRNLRIKLAAPTGKSAMRLGESIQQVKESLNAPADILNAIPYEPQTIHRMLRPVINTPYFVYGKNHTLPADVVVVDEASMVDIALMSKLMEAVPETARLILIGDKDQLASVEAGAVLGDLCGVDRSEHDSEKDRQHHFSERWKTYLNTIAEGKKLDPLLPKDDEQNISDCIVNLEKKYRFVDDGGIDVISQAINQGNIERSWSILGNPKYRSVEFKEIKSQKEFMEDLEHEVINGYQKFLKAQNPMEALKQFGGFKILSVINNGVYGVNGINQAAEFFLSQNGLIRPHTEWYFGRPILITKNDYRLELFNGDIGIIWRAGEKQENQIYAYFLTPKGELRQISPHRLPEHETVYAMTVHKAQGSEFGNVLLVLPEKDTPLLTREVLYTGVTRSRKTISIWGTPKLLDIALSRSIKRNSGLRDMLWESID